MKKLLLLSALFIFGCSNTPEKNIFVWNYSTNYDELDEQTTFKSKVYSTTQTNFDWPYGDARYFLEIKTIIPDNIKTFDDYLYHSSRTQTNLINIKCSGCPLYNYDRKSLKYKIDNNKPQPYTGYSAVKDNDELDKYAFSLGGGEDWFVENILSEQNHTKLLIEFSTVGKGNKQISFNISDFNLLDVIKRNHFNDNKKRNPKAEKLSPSSAKEIIEVPEDDKNIVIKNSELIREIGTSYNYIWEYIDTESQTYATLAFDDLIFRTNLYLMDGKTNSEDFRKVVDLSGKWNAINHKSVMGVYDKNNISLKFIFSDDYSTLKNEKGVVYKRINLNNNSDNSTPFKTAIINVNNLNFRSTPEISDNIIGTLKFEEKVIFVNSISIESNNIKKGTLNKKIIVNYEGRKYNFNKHKVVEIDGPDGDYALIVNIEVGNGEYILVSVPTSDIDFSNKKIWARIKQGNKTGYVYYKFLNFKTTSDGIALETASPAPEIIEIVEDEKEIEETVIESTETDETEAVEVENILEETEEEEVIEDIPFTIIEDVPVFPGCKGNKKELKACFNKKMQKHFARKFNADLPNDLGMSPGKKRINMFFIINKFGDIVDIRAKAPHPKLVNEAIRIIKLLPKMKPGRQRGKAVGVKYTLPMRIEVE